MFKHLMSNDWSNRLRQFYKISCNIQINVIINVAFKIKCRADVKCEVVNC